MNGKNRFRENGRFLIALFFGVNMLLWGCSGATVKEKSDYEISPSVGATEPGHKYHEFSDVLIPGELRVKPKESAIYQAPGFSAGLLILDGNVDANSLAAFFETNMAKDNWKLLSTVKFEPLMLLFEKESRACVIRIEELTFKTRVEVWVAPTPKETIVN